MEIGSEAHKELFCRTFLEGHRSYEPAELPWPELSGEQLALLKSLPFWDHALSFESDAGPLMDATAAAASDPLIREAMELQGYEELRHSRLVQFMIDRYEIEVNKLPVKAVPPDAEAAFIEFGFEECLDSFGAFGLFKLARESALFPDGLFDVFDNVMREESHHIVFFVNWYAHREMRRGIAARALRHPRAVWWYGSALSKLAGLVTDDEGDAGQDFIVTGAQAFVDDLSPRLVLSTCLAENTRRMSVFDPRLLQPRLLPRLARVALGALNLVPRRDPARGASRAGGPAV